jgi:translation initiation factor IF-2
MSMPPFGRDDMGASGDGQGSLPYFGRDTKERRGLLPRFGKSDQRHGGVRSGRTDHTKREFPSRSERYSRAQSAQSEQRFGRNTRDDVEAPSELQHTTSETDSSPIQTRVKVQDETFSKRQAAKLKDRGRNRRFDDEESAILEEEVLSAKEAKKAKKAAKRQARKELIPIFLPQFISVENLASVLGVRVEKFAKQLKEMGFTETNNDHVLGAEEAGLIAGEYGYEPVIDKGHEIDLKQMYSHPIESIAHRV